MIPIPGRTKQDSVGFLHLSELSVKLLISGLPKPHKPWVEGKEGLPEPKTGDAEGQLPPRGLATHMPKCP